MQVDSNRIVDENAVESVRLGVRTHAKSTNTLDGFENNTACCDFNANARVAMIDTDKRLINNHNMSLFRKININTVDKIVTEGTFFKNVYVLQGTCIIILCISK